MAGAYTLCLADGNYGLFMFDAFGDGWNGGSFTMTDAAGNVVFSSDGPLPGQDQAYEGFCIGADCSEPADCDYLWAACLESLVGTEWYDACSAEDCTGGVGGSCDGSVVPGLTDECGAAAYSIGSGTCEDPCSGSSNVECEAYTVYLEDSFGDGWNGNVLTVGDETFTIEDGDSATFCYDGPSDVSVTCDGGSWQSEVSWLITDADGTVLVSGGAPFSGCLGECDSEPIVPGCTDPLADNYNPDGNVVTIKSVSYTHLTLPTICSV